MWLLAVLDSSYQRIAKSLKCYDKIIKSNSKTYIIIMPVIYQESFCIKYYYYHVMFIIYLTGFYNDI